MYQAVPTNIARNVSAYKKDLGIKAWYMYNDENITIQQTAISHFTKEICLTFKAS